MGRAGERRRKEREAVVLQNFEPQEVLDAENQTEDDRERDPVGADEPPEREEEAVAEGMEAPDLVVVPEEEHPVDLEDLRIRRLRNGEMARGEDFRLEKVVHLVAK